MKRLTQRMVLIATSIVAGLCALWAFGAVWFDGPFGNGNKLAAAPLLIAFVSVFMFVRSFWRKIGSFGVLFVGILIWWLSLSPTNDRDWQPDVAQTAWAVINGDEVGFYNVRNCSYRSETDYTVNWETRTVRLAQITGMDLSIMYWGSPWMAHPIVSFRFADALPLCFSIETRKAIGQEYSALRGLYRQYTLIYIVADERDSIRVRTNYREGEDVYLYRTMASPEQARARFLEYVNTINNLHIHPRWYNAITTNCTTSIRAQRPTNQRMPWDWRILVNGKADELLYQRHLIATNGLSFAQLKQHSRINERARAADQDPDFSRCVRDSLPGFERK